VLVVDESLGASSAGGLFRVNPSTGARTLVSNFGDAAQGPLGENPFGLAIDASGSVLVVDLDAGTGDRGVLFNVNSATGVRTFISGFGNAGQGPLGMNPIGIAVVPELPPEPPPPPPPAPDTSTCNGQSATTGCEVNGVAGQSCLGTPGDDVIVGTTIPDIIVGLAGNDTISGGAGPDLICGGEGNDTLIGNKGRDQLSGDAGDDTLRGGRGADVLDGGESSDSCSGGLGSSDTAANCETVNSVP
jgi:Ca2+-binding RTX toxin-like protein